MLRRIDKLRRNRRHHFRDLSCEPGCIPATRLLLLVLIYLRPFVQDGVEQRTVNLDFSVVVDESLFPEFVHEKAYAVSGRADHFRQGFLTEGHWDRRRAAFLAEMRLAQ